jgi:transposase
MLTNKSWKIELVNASPIIIGIDVAKHVHVAKIFFPNGQELSPFSFQNNRIGMMSFVKWFRSHLPAKKHPPVIAGIESTGHYWKPLAYFLDDMPEISLVQVNPAHVKKAKEIYDNSPGKTDSKDAGIIAMLIQMRRFQRLVLPRGHFAELRVCAKLREQKVVELGVKRNILHSLVDSIFPEYGNIFKKLETKTSLYILEHFTTPSCIIALGLPRLTACIHRASRGKLSGERAKKLIEAASITVGLKAGKESTAFAIRATVASIRQIQNELADIEKKLMSILGKTPYAEQLLSIRGIGPVTLAILLGEIGDIRRYQKGEELIKLAGLNLYEISSGKHKGQHRISKRGRPLLRKSLFFATLRMVKSGGIFREDYLRLTQKNHMVKVKAIVALSKKLLRVIFALVRDDVLYQKTGHDLQLAA